MIPSFFKSQIFIDPFLRVPKNFQENVSNLKLDYLGFGIDLQFLIHIFIYFIFSAVLLLMTYLLGAKIKYLFLKKMEKLEYDWLIAIALGFIFIATGVFLLGVSSCLTGPILASYSLFLLLFSLFPLSTTKKSLSELLRGLKDIGKYMLSRKFVFFWVGLFVFLAILKLINPEIREDQYHVDFPIFFLKYQTIMIPPRDVIHVSASSMLSEMYYLLGIFLSSRELPRFIHFFFYLFTISSLTYFSKIKNYKFAIFAPLLFVTAPVIAAESSSGYVDFEWMFFLSLFLLITNSIRKVGYRQIVLCGILLGGMLATKLWTIAFIPLSILYLLLILRRRGTKWQLISKQLVVLTLSIFSIAGIWFLRAYILTGNPLYPAFLHEVSIANEQENYNLSQYISINRSILRPLAFLNVFSPLFFMGILFFLYKFKKNITQVKKLNLLLFSTLLLIAYLLINYPYGRYLLGLYLGLIFIASLGLYNIVENFKQTRMVLNLVLITLFLYYLLNFLLILPYSLGIADKNKYLTRVLIRDNSSYYDFDRKFNKYISKSDLVATYRIFGRYYANFDSVDVSYVIDKNNKSFDSLKKNGVTKLFIKGGNMEWFCKTVNLKKCDKSRYSLVSSYKVHPFYYLYQIKN